MPLSSAAAVGANPWARILDRLEKRVSRSSYDTWLRPTRFSHTRGDVVVVRVPTAEFRHLGDKYGDLIQEAIELLALDIKDVEFVTADEDPSVARPESGFPAVSAQGRPVQARFDWDSAAQLNPRYTFDGFITGAGNQFAHAAALAVA